MVAGAPIDSGPTVLTMPGLLGDAFAAAGADMADFVDIRPVDPMYRACYADGSTLFVRHGREAMSQEIREFANAKEAEAFGRFCDWLERLYRVEMAHFIDANFDSPLDLVKPWRAGLELVKLGGFGKLGRKVASFFDDERLQRRRATQHLLGEQGMSLDAVALGGGGRGNGVGHGLTRGVLCWAKVRNDPWSPGREEARA